MLGALGLVLLTAPFVTLPMPAVGGDPTLVALGSDPAQLRLFCYSTRCGDEEWQRARSPSRQFISSQGRDVVRRAELPGGDPWIGLYVPARARTSAASYANDWRVGTRYRVQAVRGGATSLGVQMGAGYRLAPLYDDGIHLPGPVLRGVVEIGHRITPRAQWSQRIQFESGHGSAFIKQSVGLDVALWPAWTLESDFTIRHVELGRSGSESAESSVRLRRRV